MTGTTLVLTAAVAIFASMAVEASISARRERSLRARGAVEPAGDVYRSLRLVYPAGFLLILAEGWLRGPAPAAALAAGAGIWLGAKALKAWAIAVLGERWSFRVLVLPSAPLVRHGPYRFLRHPNYLAVAGEFLGAALALGAPVAGVVTLAGFGLLVRRRIEVEERALGLRKGRRADRAGAGRGGG